MATLRECCELPLFEKELVETAGRPRTYFIRAGFALVTTLAALGMWLLMRNQGTTSLVGTFRIGPAIGYWIYLIETAALLWLWPVFACTALSVEKERNTLHLLLLTRLGPLTIVLEKFLSRLVMVVCLFLSTLPLMAICFGTGGSSSAFILKLSSTLLVQAIQVTAIAVMCSAWFKSTTSALIGTYVVSLVLQWPIYIAIALYQNAQLGVALSVTEIREIILGSCRLWIPTIGELTNLTVNYEELDQNNWMLLVSSFFAIQLPSLIESAVCLGLARWFLNRRSVTNATESSLKAFVDRVGRWAQRANQNVVTRGRVIISEGRRLPDNDPVAWRERTTRALGQPRYLIGNFLVLEMPIIWFLVIAVSRLDGIECLETIANMQMYLWAGMLLMITFVVSGLIIQERQKQTWDMLLTTPLTSREIVIQKRAGIERMLWILQAPLWTCLAFRAYHEGTVAYVLNEAGMLLLYPRIVAWWALASGIRRTTRVGAIVGTLGTVAAWTVAGGVLGFYIAYSLVRGLGIDHGPPTDAFRDIALYATLPLRLTPITALISNLATADFRGGVYGPVYMARYSLLPGLFNFLIYSVVLWVARHMCLVTADTGLRNHKARGHAFQMLREDLAEPSLATSDGL